MPPVSLHLSSSGFNRLTQGQECAVVSHHIVFGCHINHVLHPGLRGERPFLLLSKQKFNSKCKLANWLHSTHTTEMSPSVFSSEVSFLMIPFFTFWTLWYFLVPTDTEHFGGFKSTTEISIRIKLAYKSFIYIYIYILPLTQFQTI